MLKTAAVVLLSVGVGTVGMYYYQPKYILMANARYQYFKLGLKKKYITIGGLKLDDGTDSGPSKEIKLSYLHRLPRVQRDGHKPVLFVHGFNSTADVWLGVIKHLPVEYEVIAVNLPAHGGSGCDPDTDLTFMGITQRLRQFVEATGLSERPIHVVGQSMGATITAIYAATYPNVNQATIIAPAMHTPQSSDLFVESEESLKEYILDPDSDHTDLPPTPLIPVSAEQMETAIHLCTNQRSGLPKQILQGVVDLKRQHSEHMKLLFTNLVKDTWEEDQDDLMSKYAPWVTVPTQLMWGDEDKVCHVSGLNLLKNMLPNCVSVVRLSDTGHSINLIHPRKMAHEIEAFHSMSK